MKQAYSRMSTIKLGKNRNSPRIYLQGQWLFSAGFAPGEHVLVTFSTSRLTITLDPSATRKVSSKGNIPVIDIESSTLSQVFEQAQTLEVKTTSGSITITASYVCRLVSQRQLLPTEGSLFSGGGLLTEAARHAGFTPRFAVEIDARYAQIYEANHRSAHMFNSSVEQVPWESLRAFRPLGLLTMGIPCEPFTNIRTQNRADSTLRDRRMPPEAHELGDMIFWALRAIEAVNPHTIIAEEVPQFLDSGAGFIFRQVLRRLGYTVEARVLDPLEHGQLSDRRRAIIVATTAQIIQWPQPSTTPPPRLSAILEPSERVAGSWFDRSSKPWLFDHWDRQTRKGNGFASPKIDPSSPHMGTIKKRYFAQQGDNPVIRHPDQEGVYRWLTLAEVRRLHGVPDHYDLGDTTTTAGEVLGQGVLVSLFRKVIEAVTGLLHQ